MKLIHTMLLATLLLGACSSDEGDVIRADLAVVDRGEFPITVTESGEIKAANSTLVKNEMEGNSTIIYLIEEGSIVEKGELLVELDSSAQEEKLATQKIAVEKARASVINAQKNLEILKKQIASDTKAAKNNLLFAKMDKEKFLGKNLDGGDRKMGEKKQALEAEKAQIALDEAELKLAENTLYWSRKLRAKDFITQDQLDNDLLAYRSKKTALEVSRNKLAILEEYTNKKTELELEQAERVAGIELERTIAKGEAELIQAEADLRAAQAEETLAQDRLDNLEFQIKNARVVAPTPGIVVYATEGDRYRRKTIEIGTQVRERQSLVILPDTTEMWAELKIQEVMIDDVRPGLPATIKIDTTEMPLTGEVIRRAPLPDSGGRGSNPDLKEYKTTVRIDGDNADNTLRPNMSATVEILIAKLEDVLSVPQQAVFSQGMVQYVWLHTPRGPVATKVEVGDHNEARVVIEEGLTDGQQVYLVEPEGIEPPEFEQPPRDQPRVSAAAAARLKKAKEAAANEDKEDTTQRGGAQRGGAQRGGAQRGGAQRGGAGRTNPQFAELMRLAEAFKAKVESEDPGLHAKIVAAGMRWSRDEEVKAAIAANPTLAEAFQPYENALRKMRASSGGEGRRRRGGRDRGGNE